MTILLLTAWTGFGSGYPSRAYAGNIDSSMLRTSSTDNRTRIGFIRSLLINYFMRGNRQVMNCLA